MSGILVEKSMKINVLASIIAFTMMSATSVNAFADTAVKQDSTVVSINDAKTYADKYSQAQSEIEFLKQQLQKSQLEDQIRELKQKELKEVQAAKDKDAKKKWDEEKKALIEKYEAKISEIQGDGLKLSGEDSEKFKANKAKEKMDKVFVTRISAIGGQMKAKIYVDNSIMTKGVGEHITDGVRIAGITKDGVTLSYNGHKKFVQITTISRAQFKSFEQTGAQAAQSDREIMERQMMNSGFQPPVSSVSSPPGMIQ